MPAAKQPYERKVSEVFGYDSDSKTQNAIKARLNYECPFLGSRCLKPSQHRDYEAGIPFGACSVWHRGKGSGYAKTAHYLSCPFHSEQADFS